jgi:hypothetical protein
MCHLRGLLMLKLNRNDRAKECFLEALSLDVKCYDAFEQLVGGELMRPEEGWWLCGLLKTLFSCHVFSSFLHFFFGGGELTDVSRVGVCAELSL